MQDRKELVNTINSLKSEHKQGNAGQCSTETDECKMVSCGRSRGAGRFIIVKFKKLCSNAVFEQRCIVRRKLHSPNVSQVFLKISILVFGNTV